jgi:hypothetical protein
MWVPDVLEVTFVSKEAYREGKLTRFTEHVRPNNTDAAPLPLPFSKAPKNPYASED